MKLDACRMSVVVHGWIDRPIMIAGDRDRLNASTRTKYYLFSSFITSKSTYLGNGYIEGGVEYLSGVWLLPWLEGR